jgi:nicotinamidase-related amidase
MDILLVMNPQNSFLSKDGLVYMGEKAEILKVRLADFLSRFNKEIVFFREKHATEDGFFISDKTHSVANLPDFSICKDLRRFGHINMDKTRYNALFDTTLENILLKKRIKHIGIVGVETHTSVLFTAEELRNRSYDVTVVEPCVMSRDDYLHGFAITLMRHSLGVRVTNE